jgi:hypothetical protein
MRMEDFATQNGTTPKEDLKTKATHLKDHASEYVKTYVQLAKAKATIGASNAASGIVIAVSAVLFTFFFLIFAFTGVAWWLGGLLNSPAGGFFCVAGFFLLLIILIVALRKKVIVPMIRNSIISKVYEKD